MAGLVRRMALLGCWCVSSQSHHRGLVGSHTERNPRQMYSFLQTKRHNKVDLIWTERWLAEIKVYFDTIFILLSLFGSFPFAFFRQMSVCQSSLKNHQEFKLHQSSLKANQDHLWLKATEPSADHLSPSPQPWANHVWAGRLWLRLTRKLALTQRDVTCPWQLAEPIDPQWYVAHAGNIADRNSMLVTTSYLIHWPTGDAELVLIKWLEGTWIKKPQYHLIQVFAS